MNKQSEIDIAISILEEKCLLSSVKWLCDLSMHVDINKVDYGLQNGNLYEQYPHNLSKEYILARNLFFSHRYTDAISTIELVPGFDSNMSFLFLWGYCKYISIQEHLLTDYYEKRKQNVMELIPILNSSSLKEIENKLLSLQSKQPLDSFCNYLLGLCMRIYDEKQAIVCFIRAIRQFPLFWGVWIELSHSVTTRSHLISVLSQTHFSRFSELIWLVIINNRKEIEFPNTIMDELRKMYQNWWYFCHQECLFLYHSGKYQEALNQLDLITNKELINSDITELLALILYTMKNRVQLSIITHKTKEQVPGSSTFFFVAALHFHLYQDYSEAIHSYQNCLLVHPRHQHAWNLMGQLFIEIGQTTNAFHSFQQSLSICPQDSSCHYHKGLLFELLQSPHNSLKEYQSACEIRPYDPHLRVAMGEAYMKIGDKLKAEECYLMAESFDDMEGVCSRRLGDLYGERKGEENSWKSAYFYQRYLKKKKNVVCDDDSYRCAIALCKFYKEKRDLDNLKRVCSLLLTCNDEGTQREARGLLDCTILDEYCVF